MKLILLPGLDGTGELFSGLVASLPATFRSKVVFYRHTIGDYEEARNIVEAAIAIEPTYAIVAESFSTPLAIAIAASNPTGLKALVLCSGFASSPIEGWQRSLASSFAPLVLRVRPPSFAIRRYLIGPGASSELVLKVRTAIRSVPPRTLIRRLHGVFTCDVRRELSSILFPVLLIHGDQDRLVSHSSLNEMRALLPNARAAVINGPHLLLQASPSAAVAEIIEFLQQYGIDDACNRRT